MGIVRIVPCLIYALSLSAFAQTAEAPLSKEQRIQALRKALGSSARSESVETKTKKEPAVAPDYRERAMQELRPRERSYSADPHPSLATVRTQEIESRDPVTYQGLQVGLSTQYYHPEGTVRLVTLGERNLNKLSATAMTGLELRYMAFSTKWAGEHAWGFRGSFNYAAQNVKLYGPTGKDLGATKLHSILSSAFVSQEWIFKNGPEWSWTLDAGAGHFDMIQTGVTSLAQASSGKWLVLFRTGPSYRIGSFWMNLSYERRAPVTKGWASLASDGLLLGVQYGIR